ncbi:MAG: M28 family peptidase [Candidatus Acetothermia bacterium]
MIAISSNQQERYNSLIGDIWTSNKSWKHLNFLTDELPHRFFGTSGEQQAAQYIQKQFQEYDLEEINLEPFEVLGWKRGTTSLSLKTSGGIALEAIALPYCPQADLEGEIVDLGPGMEEDFTGDLEGKLVLVTTETPDYKGRTIHRGEKYLRAVEAGAKAFIYQNDMPGNLPSTGALASNELGAIPGVAISKETGEKIRRLMDGKEGLEVHLVVEARSEAATSHNVSGLLKANKTSKEIILGGHLDGHDISPAAEDNASSMATLLEVARVLSTRRELMGTDIRFVAFGSEEVGMLGSKHYSKSHDLDRIGLMVNMDGIGVAREPKFITCKTPHVGQLANDLACSLRYSFPVQEYISPLSDHWSFLSRGVPSCYLHPNSNTSGRGWSHTALDTRDKVQVKNIKENAMIVAMFLLKLSNCERDFGRPNPEQIKRELEDRGYGKQLEWSGK